MMAIVMQNTAVCRVAEASLRTIRALRRPQRALQRPLRHAQSLPFPVSLIGRKAKSATNSLLYNLQRLSVSRVLPGGTMAGSAIHAVPAPELPCRWPTTVVCSQLLPSRSSLAASFSPSIRRSTSSAARMFMTLAAGGLVLAAPFSNRVFQEFLLLLHEAWATVFALSRVLWGSEQLFLRCKRTSIAHDVKIT